MNMVKQVEFFHLLELALMHGVVVNVKIILRYLSIYISICIYASIYILNTIHTILYIYVCIYVTFYLFMYLCIYLTIYIYISKVQNVMNKISDVTRVPKPNFESFQGNDYLSNSLST
jgi:hypothetical protein